MTGARKPTNPRVLTSALGTMGIALVLASIPSCLPSLDPSLVTGYLCHGGVPDGVLDAADQGGEPAEECDDGNNDDGDGCDHTCHVECAPPSVKDPRTFHCYSIVPVVTAGQDPCVDHGSLGMVTIRSDAERMVVASLTGTGAGPYLTAYHASIDVTMTTDNTIHSIIAGTVYGDPGIFVSSTAAVASVCSGCYGGGESTLWSASTKSKDLVVLDPSAAFSTVRPEAAPAQVICEDAPIGDARGCSASCANGAATEKRLQAAGAAIASTYSFFSDPAKIDAAETTCEGLGTGGHLVWFESEEERELVTREFLTDLRNTRGLTFVGLRRTNGAWSWSDGVPDGPPRPYFWVGADAATNEPELCGDCATLFAPTGTTYASGLIQAMSCTGRVASACGAATAAAQTYLCKRPSP